jgi:uncharacterized membrane protein
MMRALTGMSRVGGAILLASLCLNVLLVAYIGTRWVERWRAPAIAAGPARLMEKIAHRLPAADSDVLWRVYRSQQEELTTAQKEFRDALGAAAQLLSAPKLDMDAVRTAIGKARNERIEVGDLTIGVILEALPQMSAEGRQRLISNLRRP